jgi:hypothetical protein
LTSRGYCCLTDGALEVIAAGSAFTHQARVRVLGQDEGEDFPTHILQRFRLGAYNHAVGHRKRAGGGEAAHILDFHQTESTGADGCELGVVAESWNVDSLDLSSLEDGHSRFCFHFDSVDRH